MKTVSAYDRQALELLRRYIAPHRLVRMQEVLHERTRYITCVFENMYHAHNVHAAMRSMECQGLQDLHVIDDVRTYDANTSVTKGATYWLDIHRYTTPPMPTAAAQSAGGTPACFDYLRQQGYRIYAADFAPDAFTPDNVPLDRPIALITGTEQTGVSAYAREHVDGTVMIPMNGFTQSYNVSVSVGIITYTLRRRLEQMDRHVWQLSPEEQLHTELTWLRREVRGALALERRFLNLSS